MIHPCDGQTDRRAIAYSTLSIYAICCRAQKTRTQKNSHVKLIAFKASKYLGLIVTSKRLQEKRKISLTCTETETL